MADPGHTDRIERSFTQQASRFEDKRFNQVLTTESEWLYASLPCLPSDLLLDVATGTGLAARALAAQVRAVIAIDATPQMLRLGQEQAVAQGLTNIVFQRADAAALPFLAASFDIVVCRYAMHHFEQPALPLAEMVRCLRPGGHLALADLLADENPNTANVQNHLERLRDPSHTHALPGTQLRAALERHGLKVIAAESRAIRRPLKPWMEQTQTTPEATAKIELVLTGELDRHGPASGFQPQRDEIGDLTIVQTLASFVARKLS